MATKQVNYILQIKDRFSRNLRNFKNSIDSASRKVANLRKGLFSMGKSMRNVGKKATLFMTAPIIGAFTLMAKEAIDAQETFSKFDVVFRNLGTRGEDAFRDLRDNFGLSGLEAKKLLSDTGDLLVGFGFARKEALSMSVQVQKLAVDLASFTNVEGGANRASAALTKALLGERESLKLLGVVVNESLIQDKLKSLGLGKLTGLAFKQASAMATLKIAVEQSKDSIGDFQRTIFQTANQLRIAKARFQDLRIEVGTNLIPVITELAREIIPILNGAATWVRTNKDLTKTFLKIAGAFAVFGPVLVVLSALVSILASIATIAPFVAAGIAAIFAPIGLIPTLIIAAIGGLVALFTFLEKKVGFVTKIGGFVQKIIAAGSLAGGATLIAKDPSFRQPVLEQPSSQNNVDISGLIKVQAEAGTSITKANMFNPNVGLNVAFGGG